MTNVIQSKFSNMLMSRDEVFMSRFVVGIFDENLN